MSRQELSIEDLVSAIKRGEIRLPEMQRNYVWTKTKVRDYLESLYRNYPTGSILIWVPEEEVKLKKMAVPQAEPPHKFQLLLDGQQRLSSMYAVFSGEPIMVKGQKRPINIWFNLDHPAEFDGDLTNAVDATDEEKRKQFERMIFIDEQKNLAGNSHWIPVSDIFKDKFNLTELILKVGVTDLKDPLVNKYSERINRLQEIKKYKYYVDVLDGSISYEAVTDIFIKLNSQGAQLRSTDLAKARITAIWKDAVANFEEYEEKCIKNGYDLNLGTHIKNLLSYLTGQSQYSGVAKLSKEQLKSGWTVATKGMDYALRLFQDWGIENAKLLSSPVIAISTANYAITKKYKIPTRELKELKQWVMLANAKGRYSRGSTVTVLDQDVHLIKNNAEISALLKHLKDQVGRLEIEVTDLEGKKSSSSYFKTMYLAFKSLGASDWENNLKLNMQNKSSKNVFSLQAHHVFPKALLSKNKFQTDKINDISNLVFLSGITNLNIGAQPPSEYLQKIIEQEGREALKAQCIPMNSKLWEIERFEDFLVERRKLITKCLNQFLGVSMAGK